MKDTIQRSTIASVISLVNSFLKLNLITMGMKNNDEILWTFSGDCVKVFSNIAKQMKDFDIALGDLIEETVQTPMKEGTPLSKVVPVVLPKSITNSSTSSSTIKPPTNPIHRTVNRAFKSPVLK
jgi:hypothetical protein